MLLTYPDVWLIGSSLLRIDDLGIVPEIREQAMLMGARAAEAVREGSSPHSILTYAGRSRGFVSPLYPVS
jgi:hypothetical protein